MIDLICSETDRIVGSLDVEPPTGRGIMFPTEPQAGRPGFGRIELRVARFVDADRIERAVLLVDPAVLPIVQRLGAFKPPLATH